MARNKRHNRFFTAFNANSDTGFEAKKQEKIVLLGDAIKQN